MPQGPYDINYGTNPQVEYARAMAKYLREKKGFQMTPGMAVLPGSWAHGLGDIVDAISQGRYQDIAGQQDKTLTMREINPNYVPQSAPSTVGSSLSQSLHGLYKKYNPFGGKDNKVIPPGTEPKDLTTGSIPPVDATVEPKEETNYADLVKQRENPDLFSGKTKESKAQWDFQQHTNGFGTKATNEDEKIGVDEAHQRFDSEWKRAQEAVDKFKPGLPVGPRAALTSLTFNSGQKWMNSGLGAAVQADDPVKAKELFLQYNKATDAKTGQTSVLAELKERRNQEAQWFDDVTPNVPKPKLVGQMNLGGPKGELDPRLTAGPQGDQVAQGYGVQPVQTPAPQAPTQGVAGAYSGVVPPRNPTATDEQYTARMLNAASPEQRAAITEQHKKDLEGRTYETQGGGKLRVPGDIQGQVTHIPGADIPDFMGLGIRLRQGADGSIKLLTPSGQEIPNTIEGLNKYKADLEASRTRITGRAGIMTEHYAKQENEITQRARGAAVNRQMLGLAKQMSNDPNFYSGTGAERVLDYKKIASYLSGNPNWSGSTEAFGKLLARANIEGLEAFKGYGQIRNPEIELLQKSSGELTNTPGAIQAIIDMNDRASERLIEIGDKMREYRNKHNTLDEGFDTEMAKFYKDRPLYTDEEIKNYKELFKMEKNKGSVPWTDLGQGVRRQKIE